MQKKSRNRAVKTTWYGIVVKYEDYKLMLIPKDQNYLITFLPPTM